MSESTRFRLNVALIVGTIVAALHLFLGIRMKSLSGTLGALSKYCEYAHTLRTGT
jgi:hypothetical protein